MLSVLRTVPRLWWAAVVICGVSANLVAPAALVAEEPEGGAFFEKKIRPMLVKHCYQCHSEKADEIKGGLRVDTREGIRTGGDSGPAIVPGNLEESLLIQAIGYGDDFYKMPPERKLPDEVISDFRKWVTRGAPDPRAAE